MEGTNWIEKQAKLAANARQRPDYKPQEKSPDTPVPSTASKASTKARKKHSAEEALPLEAFLTQPDPSARRIISYKGKLVAQKPEGKAQATFDNGDVRHKPPSTTEMSTTGNGTKD